VKAITLAIVAECKLVYAFTSKIFICGHLKASIQKNHIMLMLLTMYSIKQVAQLVSSGWVLPRSILSGGFTLHSY
jgi:hypothetical protein